MTKMTAHSTDSTVFSLESGMDLFRFVFVTKISCETVVIVKGHIVLSHTHLHHHLMLERGVQNVEVNLKGEFIDKFEF